MAVANLCPARHLAEVLPVHSPMHTGVCVSVRCCRWRRWAGGRSCRRGTPVPSTTWPSKTSCASSSNWPPRSPPLQPWRRWVSKAGQRTGGPLVAALQAPPRPPGQEAPATVCAPPACV